MKSSVSSLTAPVVALAAALGLSLSGIHRAGAAPLAPATQADNGPAVTILSPVPRTSFSGIKPVEISAFYQGSSTNQIVTLELYVDGIKAAQKVLDAPETRGVVSFLVDASALNGGTHRIVVRATAADAEVASAKSSFLFEIPTPEQPAPGVPNVTPSQGAPTLSIQNPAVNGQVQGKVTIRVQASDPSGKAPYVSLFIDHSFKTLRNYAPYEFTWDTSDYSNGYHTIEAFGYNDSQDVGHAAPMRVFVNNPGGRTERRTDLQDAPKPTPIKAVKSASVKSVIHAKAPARPVVQALAPAKVTAVKPLPKALAAVPTRAKSAPIPRRPAPAVLAAASATAHDATKLQTQIARLPDLAHETLALTGMPGLSSPFIADTAATVRPKAAAPTSGFKPLLPSVKAVSPADAELAVTPTAGASSTVTSPVHLQRMAKVLPQESLTLGFLTAPTVPGTKHAVRLLTVHQSQPTVSVKTLHFALPEALRMRHFGIHAPHISNLTARLDWLKTAGQSTLMFNSSRLPLERPLTDRGSVLFGPLRQIFQSDGGSLTWQARTGVVTGLASGRSIQLTMGQKKALVNEQVVLLDGAPYVNDGRTMIPVSFLQKALNVAVQFDAATGHLLITSNK